MFRSTAEITFEGLNFERTLNLLVKKGVTLYKAERNGKRCTVTVPFGKRRQVVDFLEERCYNIIRLRAHGFAALKEQAVRHTALFIAVLLVIPLLALSSQFCFEVVITGDYAADVVCECLQQLGLGTGRSLAELDCDAAENAIAARLDAMYAVVERRGSALYVHVIKRAEADAPVDMSKRYDLKSSRSGVVEHILTVQGTANVKVGDTVKAGDVLIYGQRTFSDGTAEDIRAVGEVVIRAEASGFAAYTGERTVTRRTGNTFTRTLIRFVRSESYFREVPFENYETEEEIVCLSPLNIAVVKQTCYELSSFTETVTLDEVREELKAAAYAMALNGADFTVTEVLYAVNSQGVTATVYGKVTVS